MEQFFDSIAMNEKVDYIDRANKLIGGIVDSGISYKLVNSNLVESEYNSYLDSVLLLGIDNNFYKYIASIPSFDKTF